MTNHSLIIEADDNDIRLDRWFKRHYPHISHGDLQKALRKGLIRLDGKKPQMDARVQTDQIVTVKFLSLDAPPDAEKKKPKQKIITLTPEQVLETQSWVLFRNAQVLVLNKPAGLAVQGGSGLSDYLDARMGALRFDSKYLPRLVHRLDKDTSGALLLGRSPQAASELGRAFTSKRVRKIYWALVVGVPEIREGEIEGAMEKSDGDYEKMQLDEGGKHALTRYRVIEALGTRMAWVELEPITGRTHQLRVHMAELGHPIVGDGKYGGKDAFVEGSLDLPRQLHLHARQVVVKNITGGNIDVVAPLPKHMQKSFDLLGLVAE